MIRYTYADHLGSPVVGTSATGAVEWRETYRPSGLEMNFTAGNDNQPGFTGHLEDDRLDLVYMQARFYNPVTGRFLSTDPIGYEDQLNLYAYVANDPVNKVDPNGEAKISVGVTATAVLKLGATGSIGISFDTQTLELSGSFTLGGRVGFDVGLGLNGSVSESGSGPAENSLVGTTGVTADANFGPIGISQNIVSLDTNGNASTVLNGGNTASGSIDLAPELKSQLRFGASVGVDAIGEARTSVVADAVQGVKDVLNQIGNLAYETTRGQFLEDHE